MADLHTSVHGSPEKLRQFGRELFHHHSLHRLVVFVVVSQLVNQPVYRRKNGAPVREPILRHPRSPIHGKKANGICAHAWPTVEVLPCRKKREDGKSIGILEAVELIRKPLYQGQFRQRPRVNEDRKNLVTRVLHDSRADVRQQYHQVAPGKYELPAESVSHPNGLGPLQLPRMLAVVSLQLTGIFLLTVGGLPGDIDLALGDVERCKNSGNRSNSGCPCSRLCRTIHWKAHEGNGAGDANSAADQQKADRITNSGKGGQPPVANHLLIPLWTDRHSATGGGTTTQRSTLATVKPPRNRRTRLREDV